jgi:hypothetical protein
MEGVIFNLSVALIVTSFLAKILSFLLPVESPVDSDVLLPALRHILAPSAG